MSARLRGTLGTFAVFAVLGVSGLAATAYLLINQRVENPLRDVYRLTLSFTAADGVLGGLGQPVDVAGVKVGQVVDARLDDGRAKVTVEIDKGDLPHVYADATATLEPITPLKDMQITLDPGDPPARPLRPGATLDVAHTTAPVPLSDLLSSLDADTRDYLSSLIAGLDQGTRGRGDDINRFVSTLGPTMRQVRDISDALARRRSALADLVHNLGGVTNAAAADGRLAQLVRAGHQTLQAVAQADGPLRSSVAQLAPTLRVTRATLRDITPFAASLPSTVSAISPAVRSLPRTLSAVTRFSKVAERSLRTQVRPLVRTAQPAAREIGRSVPDVSAATPALSRTFQALQYVVNELAYNPPGSSDEGLMFWVAWFAHNVNSVVSAGDANGGIGRASLFVSCHGLEQVGALRTVFEAIGPCGR